MGQKVNATGYRLGLSSEYKSIWFEVDNNTYSTLIRHDTSITEYIYNILKKYSILCTNIKKIYYNDTLYLFVYYFNTKKSKVPLSFNNKHEPNVDYYIRYLMQRIYNKYKIKVAFIFKEVNQDDISSSYIAELLKFEYENKKSINLKDTIKSIILNISFLDNKNTNIYYIKNTESQLNVLVTQLLLLLERCNKKNKENQKEFSEYKHQLLQIYDIVSCTVQNARNTPMECVGGFAASAQQTTCTNTLNTTKSTAITNASNLYSVLNDKNSTIKDIYLNNKKIIGMRIEISGRINGAEMAKTEKYIIGSIPFQELKTKIEYSCTAAVTMYGLIGIKTWIAWGN